MCGCVGRGGFGLNQPCVWLCGQGRVWSESALCVAVCMGRGEGGGVWSESVLCVVVCMGRGGFGMNQPCVWLCAWAGEGLI